MLSEWPKLFGVLAALSAVGLKPNKCSYWLRLLTEVLRYLRIWVNYDSLFFLQLSQVIPPRTVGYPWSLIYSTDKHGFSLKTLYRDMAGLDSPILLVVKDTQDHVSKSVFTDI